MKARLNRLLAEDGRCLDVAVDHGLFGEPSLLLGIEDMVATVRALVDGAPDAIQLSPGQAPLLQVLPGPRKPALVLRADVANVYAQDLPRTPFSDVLEAATTHAVQLDAACLCVNLLMMEDQPELYRQCVRNVSGIVAMAEPVGMPVMVEPLALRRSNGRYLLDGNAQTIAALVRQAVELGADVIKADPTDDLNQYPQVIQAAGRCPLLVRGGSRVGDRQMLQRAQAVMAHGAAGIVYGRNIIQHDKPIAATRALMAIVHQGASVATALELIRDSAR